MTIGEIFGFIKVVIGFIAAYFVIKYGFKLLGIENVFSGLSDQVQNVKNFLFGNRAV